MFRQISNYNFHKRKKYGSGRSFNLFLGSKKDYSYNIDTIRFLQNIILTFFIILKALIFLMFYAIIQYINFMETSNRLDKTIIITLHERKKKLFESLVIIFAKFRFKLDFLLTRLNICFQIKISFTKRRF